MFKKLLTKVLNVLCHKPNHFALMVHHQRESDFHGHAGRHWDAAFHMTQADMHADKLNAQRSSKDCQSEYECARG